MNKKLLALLLAAVMVFALAACGGGETEPTDAPVTDAPATDGATAGGDLNVAGFY